jgi:hypothetical protein
MRYFSTAGEDIGSSWVGFRRQLDAWADGATGAQRQAVVDAAIMTFRVVHHHHALESLSPHHALPHLFSTLQATAQPVLRTPEATPSQGQADRD